MKIVSKFRKKSNIYRRLCAFCSYFETLRFIKEKRRIPRKAEVPNLRQQGAANTKDQSAERRRRKVERGRTRVQTKLLSQNQINLL